LTARGGSNNINAGNSVRPGTWMFVAGTWDYETGTHRLYWNNRYIEEPLGTGKRPRQEYSSDMQTAVRRQYPLSVYT